MAVENDDDINKKNSGMAMSVVAPTVSYTWLFLMVAISIYFTIHTLDAYIQGPDEDLANNKGAALFLWPASVPIRISMDSLALIIAIAAGALGSVLQIAYDYFRHPNQMRKFAEFVIPPLLGTCAAIVVYIAFKAGVLVITDSGTGGGLNGYFIAFVGIISGFMAESAVQTIRAAGSSVFRASVQRRDRWAVDLDAQIAAQPLSREEIAARIGVTKNQLDEWASEQSRVPFDHQLMLRTILDKDMRSLFSDERG